MDRRRLELLARFAFASFAEHHLGCGPEVALQAPRAVLQHKLATMIRMLDAEQRLSESRKILDAIAYVLSECEVVDSGE